MRAQENGTAGTQLACGIQSKTASNSDHNRLGLAWVLQARWFQMEMEIITVRMRHGQKRQRQLQLKPQGQFDMLLLPRPQLYCFPSPPVSLLPSKMTSKTHASLDSLKRRRQAAARGKGSWVASLDHLADSTPTRRRRRRRCCCCSCCRRPCLTVTRVESVLFCLFLFFLLFFSHFFPFFCFFFF